MKIYTRGGDQGKTSLLGGHRVPKSHARVEAYGTVDELNSSLGIILTSSLPEQTRAHLTVIQSTLFTLGSSLAQPQSPQEISAESVTRLEDWIDQLTVDLPPLTNFILPGGCQASAHCHLARTICRRAERCCVALSQEATTPLHHLAYLNRLSDYLFVLARYLNKQENSEEITWKSTF